MFKSECNLVITCKFALYLAINDIATGKIISCSMIGVYFAFFKKNIKNSEDESNYLVGGRKLKIFPVAMSLIAR